MTKVEYIGLVELGPRSDIAAELGNVVIAWSYLEQWLVALVAKCERTGENEAQNVLARLNGFARVSERVRVAIKHSGISSGHAAAISIELEKCNELAATRNLLIHGRWTARDDYSELLVHHYKKKQKDSVSPQTLVNHREAVIATARRIAQLSKLIP